MNARATRKPKSSLSSSTIDATNSGGTGSLKRGGFDAWRLIILMNAFASLDFGIGSARNIWRRVFTAPK
jgi:hypothetical protein